MHSNRPLGTPEDVIAHLTDLRLHCVMQARRCYSLCDAVEGEQWVELNVALLAALEDLRSWAALNPQEAI